MTSSPGNVDDRNTTNAIEPLLRMQRDLSLALAETDNLFEVLDLCLRAASQIQGITCGGIYLVDPASGALDLTHMRGLPDWFVEVARHFPADARQTELVMVGLPIYTHYSRLAVLSGPDRQRLGLRAFALVPVKYQGQVIAALNLASHTDDVIGPPARDAIETIAERIGGAITRVRATERLRTSQQNLQALFDAIDDMLFILDTNGVILQVNPAVERRLGYPMAELRGQAVTFVHPPEQRAEVAECLARWREAATSVCTLPLLARDGSRIAVEMRLVQGQWDGQAVLFGVSRALRTPSPA